MIKTIGIIGGSGKMGSSFSKNFQKIGLDVIVSDEKSHSKEKELLSKSDWIILCVPINRTLEVFRKINRNTEIKKNELSIDLVVEGQVIGDTEAILARAYKHLKNEIKREGDYTINARINFIPIRTFTFQDRNEQSKVD